MYLERIKNSTPVREFPDIYNNNVDRLVEEINELNDIINEKDEKIKELETRINKLVSVLTAKFTKEFDVKFIDIENRISAIESKLND